MSRQRLCRACGKWHDTDAEWPDACIGHFRKYDPRPQIHVIKDIEPYKNMIDGNVIKSRRHHRDFLRAHGCIEIGNDFVRPKREFKPPPGLVDDIRAAISQVRNK